MIADLRQYIEELMIPIQGGSFEMGESYNKHKVTLDSFSMAKYPVTQALCQAVTGKNPSYFKGANRPVEQVSWYDAVEFCNLLSEKLDLDPYYKIDKEPKDPNNENEYDDIKWRVEVIKGANGYRLPTEAEWEYAGRGGKDWQDGFEYAGSNELDEVGWYYENSHEESKEVGLKAPNQLGLYDMSGNVFEWCWDWYDSDYYENSLEQNPLGPEKGSSRVVRGGSWVSGDIFSRVVSAAWRSASSSFLSSGTLIRVFASPGLTLFNFTLSVELQGGRKFCALFRPRQADRVMPTASLRNSKS